MHQQNARDLRPSSDSTRPEFASHTVLWLSQWCTSSREKRDRGMPTHERQRNKCLVPHTPSTVLVEFSVELPKLPPALRTLRIPLNLSFQGEKSLPVAPPLSEVSVPRPAGCPSPGSCFPSGTDTLCCCSARPDPCSGQGH